MGDTTNGKAPNIQGGVEHWHAQKDGASLLNGATGCFVSGLLQTIQKLTTSGTTNATVRTLFDASRSSSVYDSTATGIVPAGVYTLWCIKY